jgi:hypothetical protein
MDALFAVMTAHLLNAWREPDSDPVSPADLMPVWDPAPPPEPEELDRRLRVLEAIPGMETA